jgi:DNA-binding response OmpR family regulator
MKNNTAQTGQAPRQPAPGKLGTFAGVFTPSVLTILGIILFLRLGFVVGSAGLERALLILLLANGIVMFLAQSISIAFYCIGFGEVLAALISADNIKVFAQLVAAAAVSTALLFAVYQYLKRTSGPARWADSQRAYRLQQVREHLLAAGAVSVLREIRQAGMTTPVLMLTAKREIGDRIKGLDLGADDYLAKPFSLDELLARIRALFRRSGGQAESVLQVKDLRLDTVSREVTKAGKPVELTAREFSILEFLFYNKNRAVSRFSLAEHVWGDAFDPFSMSNFMDVHIKNLRRKIGDPDHGTIIRTIRGVGYIIKDDAE